jgi:menaquinone-dependent protoporphyrinogen oxidase
MRILVTYATKHGSTTGVADTIADELRSAGNDVDILQLGSPVDLREYEAVVLGAPLYNAKWLSPARRFLKRNRPALAEKPVAVFALGPREDTPEAWPRCRAQLDRALAKFDWLAPVAIELFGGADPPGKGSGRDIRDWAMIRAWADGLPEAFGGDGVEAE